MINSVFKWHEAALVELLKRAGRLPHALLLKGPEGTGVAEFAVVLAQCLLCESPQTGGGACGQCSGCNWYRLGNHPDFRLVQPDSYADDDPEAETEKKGADKKNAEKKSTQIRIDQVRALQDFLSVGTHRAGRRVVVLHPADTMNEPTQNALLKSLEEPPPASIFILVTSRPDRLLPTIRSRCQALTLPRPDREASLAWLEAQSVPEASTALALAGGAPLSAAELAGRAEFILGLSRQLADRRMEPIALAAASANATPSEFVAALYRWCFDVLSVGLAGRVRYHPSSEAALREVSGRCRPEKVAAFLRTLAEASSLAQHPLNPKLFFEDLLVRYRALFAA